VSLLLEHGADPLIKNEDGNTAQTIAQKYSKLCASEIKEFNKKELQKAANLSKNRMSRATSLMLNPSLANIELHSSAHNSEVHAPLRNSTTKLEISEEQKETSQRRNTVSLVNPFKKTTFTHIVGRIRSYYKRRFFSEAC